MKHKTKQKKIVTNIHNNMLMKNFDRLNHMEPNLPSGSWSPVRSQSNKLNPMFVDNLTSMQAWNIG